MATFTPIDLSTWFNAPRKPQPSPWHLRIEGGMAELPQGKQAFWGIPFLLGEADAGRSWIQLKDNSVSIPVAASQAVTYVAIAHFCDAAVDPAYPDVAPGMVTRPGETLADYVLVYSDGSHISQPIRRRFEINEFTQWGQWAFAARSHAKDAPLDINGPYPRQDRKSVV